TLANPLRHAIEAVHRVYLEDAGIMTIFNNLWPLAAIGTVTLPSAAWLFRHRLVWAPRERLRCDITFSRARRWCAQRHVPSGLRSTSPRRNYPSVGARTASAISPNRFRKRKRIRSGGESSAIRC